MSKLPLVTTISEEMIARITGDVRTYTPTGELRFATPNWTTTKPPRLQQAFRWRSDTEGGIEWRDVPTVIVND